MTSLFNWNSRDSVKLLEAICFWTGIGFFFVCAAFGLAGNQSAACNIASGIAFIVGLVIEIASRFCDNRLDTLNRIVEDEAAARREREAQKHQQETQSLRTEITRLQTRTAARQITEDGKEALGKVLAKYPKQSLWITAEYNDDEAWPFANQISKVFQQFGWSGGVVRNPLEDGAIRAFPGVGITAEPMEGNPDWAVQIIRDISGVFEADGIKMATNWSRILPPPAGRAPAIEIHVGKRPSEVESLRSEIATEKAPRTLTQAHKEMFKARLSKYAPQKFQIIQIGFNNREAIAFANLIHEALTYCGWEGGHVLAGYSVLEQPAEIDEGVTVGAIFGWMIKKAKAGNEYKLAEVEAELRSVFREVGIEGAKGIGRRYPDKLPIPPDTVEIIVGPKPS